MAKKGQVTQLQTDITTDDEWNKLMNRDGLIVVDVYSGWCGPCTAMQANLKRIKLEFGGDFLHLAMARSDNVTVLKRFADRSEPIWMIIAKGQMIQLIFGANAPILQNAILQEIKNEKECLEGKRERIQHKPEDLTEIEMQKSEAAVLEEHEKERIVQEKMLSQLKQQRAEQAKHIIDAMGTVGLILVFPHAIKRAPDILENLWGDAGLSVTKKDRIVLNEAALEEIDFFSPYKIPALSRKQLTSGEKAFAMMINQGESVTTPIDETILNFVYGSNMCPPGDSDSPAQILIKRTQNAAEEEDNIFGLWAPANELVKAVALKFFFPHIVAPYVVPEIEMQPPHLVIIFDAFKRQEVFKVIEEYRDEVMSYGFFSDENYLEAKLLARTLEAFEKKIAQSTYSEKLVLKVVRKECDALLAFAELGPTYISLNVIEGEKECFVFFPAGYNDMKEEEEEQTKVGKKKKGKGRVSSRASDTPAEPGEIIFEEGVVGDGAEEYEEMVSHMSDIEEENKGTITDNSQLTPRTARPEEDKATSPMEDFPQSAIESSRSEVSDERS